MQLVDGEHVVQLAGQDVANVNVKKRRTSAYFMIFLLIRQETFKKFKLDCFQP